MERLTARAIHAGQADGTVLHCQEPIGFFGHVDPETGIVHEPGHPLEGQSLAGRILVFPRAKGSTVGSYVLYALSRAGKAPAAMLLTECESIVAVGAIIGRIPTYDRVEIHRLREGDRIRVDGDEVYCEAVR